MKKYLCHSAAIGGRMTTLFLSSVFSLSGCGYTTQTVLPAQMKSIYVDTAVNRIPISEVFVYKPGLEIEVTNAIIQRLQRDGNLRVTSREKADVVLESDLVGFSQEGLRFNTLERVSEYRLFVTLALKLKNNKTGEVIWTEPHFTGDAEYFVSRVRSLGREEAAGRAVERLARNVVDRIVEDW